MAERTARVEQDGHRYELWNEMVSTDDMGGSDIPGMWYVRKDGFWVTDTAEALRIGREIFMLDVS